MMKVSMALALDHNHARWRAQTFCELHTPKVIHPPTQLLANILRVSG
jgi:hypothetical protein